MNLSHEHRQELEELLEQLCAGEIDQPQLDRLQAIVLESTEARDLYLEAMRIHHGLEWLFRDPEPTASPANAAKSPVAPSSPRPTVPTSAPPVTKSPRRPLTRSSVAWSILAASLLFAAYFVGISWDMLGRKPAEQLSSRDELLPSPPEGEGPGVRGRAPRVDSDSGTSVATITDTADVEWASSSPAAAQQPGCSVHPGKPLSITAGLVELQLKQGVTLVIEGPAEWSIDGNNNATLKRGKLVAKVPQQAIGFTLETPTAKIVDLGTEFGVEVGTAGKTNVVVLKGLVEAGSKGELNAKTTRLQAGQACRIVDGQLVELESGNARLESFVRTLPRAATPSKPWCVSHGKPVKASSVFVNQAQTGETFHAENVTDGRYDDTGAPQAWSFWLASDMQPAEFTVDLKDAFLISEIRLQNTHNRQHNDRGTREYRLSVSPDGKDFVTIKQDVLADVAGQTATDWIAIPVDPATEARYVRFEALSYYGVGAGLSELQVFGTIPPATKEAQ